MRSRFRGGVGALVLGLALAAGGTAAAAGPQIVADANIDEFVQYSAWATLNSVSSSDCTGTGAVRRIPGGGNYHSTFTCKIETYKGTAATVTVKALGPEWVRVTSTGGLEPEPSLGVLPKGPRAVAFSSAGTALERSAWGKAHDVDSAFCLGVGPYEERPTDYFYFTFSCATLDTFASRGPHVLISVTSKGVAKVIRTVVP